MAVIKVKGQLEASPAHACGQGCQWDTRHAEQPRASPILGLPLGLCLPVSAGVEAGGVSSWKDMVVGQTGEGLSGFDRSSAQAVT